MQIETLIYSLIILSTAVFVNFVIKNRILIFSINWIMFWMFIASLNIFSASFYPYYSLILFWVFIMVISLMSSINIGTNHYINTEIDEKQCKIIERFVNLVFFIIIPIMVVMAVKSLLLLQNYNIYDFRRAVFSSESGILPTGFLPIYTLVIGGLNKFSLIASLYLFSIGRGKRYLTLPLLTTILNSMISLGRFPIYEFSLLLFLCMFYQNKIKVKHSFYGICTFLILISFSIIRSGSYYDFSSVIQKHILGYHTYGFYLLEHKINTTTILVDSWLGLASLGSFGYFITLPLTWVTEFVTYMQSNYFLRQDDFINVGTMMNGDKMLANAFYTILYEPYNDFGIFGVVFLALILGLLSRTMILEKKSKLLADMILLFVGSILLSGIMKSSFIRHDVILPVLIFMFFYLFFKKGKVLGGS
ncbi:O-antigen polymerase [Vibrio splendidus]